MKNQTDDGTGVNPASGAEQGLTPDPAERSAYMRLFYRGWHPTRFGRWVNRIQCWYSSLGLPPAFQVALEVRGRRSGRIRATAVGIATVAGQQYLVSMLGLDSDWVKNVQAAQGEAVVRHGSRRKVHLVLVPTEQRAPIIREYVRIASSGRRHFPLAPGAEVLEFESVAGRYPVYRIDPPRADCKQQLDGGLG
jgi:deazaflavin-dependent oxidoreductase (nitroreductase family)